MRRALVLLLAACGSGQPAPAPGAAATTTGPLTSNETGEVVARVNGVAIYAADVAAQAAARGQTPAQAADELVAAELLAQEAFRRGLADDPEVRAARDRELVRVINKRVFEPSFDGPEDIPQDEVDKALSHPQVKAFYDHDTYHTVAWVRAEVAKGSPPERDGAAREAAAAFAAQARAAHPATAAEFFALAQKMPPAQKLRVAGNQTFTTTLNRGPAEASFARAAFTLAKVGDVSEASRTPWGWDVLLLTEIIPAQHLSRAEADKDVRTRIFDSAKRTAWKRWSDGLMRPHQITTNPALVDDVQVDSLVGM